MSRDICYAQVNCLPHQVTIGYVCIGHVFTMRYVIICYVQVTCLPCHVSICYVQVTSLPCYLTICYVHFTCLPCYLTICYVQVTYLPCYLTICYVQVTCLPSHINKLLYKGHVFTMSRDYANLETEQVVKAEIFRNSHYF